MDNLRQASTACYGDSLTSLLLFVAERQIAVEEQSVKMASDMEVLTKQRCVTEFLHAEKIAPVDIHRRLLDAYGDQTVGVSTVRLWVVRYSSGDTDVRDRPRSEALSGAERRIQCFGNDVGNVRISQSLCQMGPMDAHTGT
jgi:hypothetical protein